MKRWLRGNPAPLQWDSLALLVCWLLTLPNNAVHRTIALLDTADAGLATADRRRAASALQGWALEFAPKGSRGRQVRPPPQRRNLSTAERQGLQCSWATAAAGTSELPRSAVSVQTGARPLAVMPQGRYAAAGRSGLRVRGAEVSRSGVGTRECWL